MRGASCRFLIGTTLLQDSLYTFLNFRLGLARDCPRGVSPNSPRFRSKFLWKAAFATGSCSTIELPRNTTVNKLTCRYYIPVLLDSANPTLGVIMLVMTKMCRKHGQTKHFPRPDGAFRCGKCASGWVIRNRRNKKEKLVAIFGGKCIVCGYKKYVGALDFHHTNPSTKEFALSVKGLSYSWESLLREAKKCVLVCKNCHTEIGSGITKL